LIDVIVLPQQNPDNLLCLISEAMPLIQANAERKPYSKLSPAPRCELMHGWWASKQERVTVLDTYESKDEEMG